MKRKGTKKKGKVTERSKQEYKKEKIVKRRGRSSEQRNKRERIKRKYPVGLKRRKKKFKSEILQWKGKKEFSG